MSSTPQHQIERAVRSVQQRFLLNDLVHGSLYFIGIVGASVLAARTASLVVAAIVALTSGALVARYLWRSKEIKHRDRSAAYSFLDDQLNTKDRIIARAELGSSDERFEIIDRQLQVLLAARGGAIPLPPLTVSKPARIAAAIGVVSLVFVAVLGLQAEAPKTAAQQLIREILETHREQLPAQVQDALTSVEQKLGEGQADAEEIRQAIEAAEQEIEKAQAEITKSASENKAQSLEVPTPTPTPPATESTQTKSEVDTQNTESSKGEGSDDQKQEKSGGQGQGKQDKNESGGDSKEKQGAGSGESQNEQKQEGAGQGSSAKQNKEQSGQQSKSEQDTKQGQQGQSAGSSSRQEQKSEQQGGDQGSQKDQDQQQGQQEGQQQEGKQQGQQEGQQQEGKQQGQQPDNKQQGQQPSEGQQNQQQGQQQALNAAQAALTEAKKEQQQGSEGSESQQQSPEGKPDGNDGKSPGNKPGEKAPLQKGEQSPQSDGSTPGDDGASLGQDGTRQSGPGREPGKSPYGDNPDVKDTEIGGKDQAFDTRYTSKDGEVVQNTKDAKSKVDITSIDLAKPDAAKNREKQPIPLEYRDLLE